MDADLETLIRFAYDADGMHRFEFRDPIAAHLDEGIAAVRPFLADDLRRPLALAVIRKAHEAGATTAAETLRDELDDTSEEGARADIEHLIAEIAPKSRPTRSKGTKQSKRPDAVTLRLESDGWPRRYMFTANFWHLIVDEARRDGSSTRYLGACRRWGSEEYVNTGKRHVDSTRPEALYCSNCEKAELKGLKPAHGMWETVTAASADGDEPFMRRNATWHLLEHRELYDADALGTVHLTECGWWVEAGRVELLTSRPATTPAPVCEPCIRFRAWKARAPDEPAA